METSVTRYKAVPAFAITIDELQELHGYLCAEFPQEENAETSIEIDHEGIEYEFLSFDDLRRNYTFKEAVTDFRMNIRSEKRSIEIGKPLIALAAGQVEIYAHSETMVWCEGISILADVYLTKRRVWYHWILRTNSVIIMLAVTSIAVAYAFSLYIPSEYKLDFLAVPIGIFAGLILLSLRSKTMSVASLSIGEKRPKLPIESIVQLAIALISLVATTVGIVLQLTAVGTP